MRTTQDGRSVCNFSVAVNRRGKKDQKDKETDYFRVAAWNQLGENCAKYLAKGRKVAVIGSVSIHTWDSNGKHGASMEVIASDVEYLSPRSENVDQQTGYTKVDNAENVFPPESDDTPY